MRENKFQKKVITALNKRLAFIINLHGHSFQRAGLPDLEIIHKDWHGFIELKVEQGKVSEVQKSVARRIAARDVPIYVLRRVEIETPYKPYYRDTLEDFHGKVIKDIFPLSVLLNTLISLKRNGA